MSRCRYNNLRHQIPARFYLPVRSYHIPQISMTISGCRSFLLNRAHEPSSSVSLRMLVLHAIISAISFSPTSRIPEILSGK
jgi:hypothetical protein